MVQQTIAGFLDHADDIIISTLNEFTLIGLGVGIVHKGQLVYARGFGLADVDSNQPVTPDTIFKIGTIAETATAVGVMQLWEQKRLQLDDSVNDYLTAFQVAYPYASALPVTLRHILTHTAGFGKESLHFARLSLRSLTAHVGSTARRVKPAIVPQVAYYYAPLAFRILDQVLEDTTGMPCAKYLAQHVFDPLGMKQTSYEPLSGLHTSKAQGYMLKGKKIVPVASDTLGPSEFHLASSSVADMSRYMIALLRQNQQYTDDSVLLKPETLALMMEPHYQLDNRLPAMGLSFGLDTLDGSRVATHYGKVPGFSSALLLVPSEELGVVVLANMASIAPMVLARDVLHHMLALPSDSALQVPSIVAESPHLWADLCGVYGVDSHVPTGNRLLADIGNEVDVVVKDGELVFRSLIGPLRSGIRLHAADRTDPLVFTTSLHDKIVWFPGCTLPYGKVVFKQNIKGQIDRLCAGPSVVYKRPWQRSMRVKGLLATGILLGMGAFFIRKLWQRAKAML